MKKKYLRKIKVDGQDYVWTVTGHNCDGDGGDLLKVWLNKKLLFENLIHVDSITPSLVKSLIQGFNIRIKTGIGILLEKQLK